MGINIFKLFKRKESIQNDFSKSGFQSLDVKELIYPLFIPLEKKGLLAYSTRFMVKSEDLSKVEDLVERYYHKENMQEKRASL
ncbi:hypothetical protein QEP13_03595 [Enterobacter ludwigii]|uniref:Uncharacterized protein n=1 Tax=Enterobacter cloacae TaxID=550 RepID=A0A4Q2E217_ENTCL|nr:hypothetical protein [Enterobacter cloacae]RXW25982.1 hypothetical protein DM877_26845 [Enterobacter cloacae]